MAGNTENVEVSADHPDSPFRTTGTDHITIWGSNKEDTLEFYRDLLGMPLVLKQPNLDAPEETHLFFDTGDGTILTVFVNDNRESAKGSQRVGTGGVHHLCFSVDPDRFEEVAEALDDNGHRYSMFDRGIFLSLYTTDHNGLVIELTVDKFEYPDERKGEVLARAHHIRTEQGADFAKTEHLQQALDDLDIEYEENDLPEAESGSAGL